MHRRAALVRAGGDAREFMVTQRPPTHKVPLVATGGEGRRPVVGPEVGVGAEVAVVHQLQAGGGGV